VETDVTVEFDLLTWKAIPSKYFGRGSSVWRLG